MARGSVRYIQAICLDFVFALILLSVGLYLSAFPDQQVIAYSLTAVVTARIWSITYDLFWERLYGPAIKAADGWLSELIDYVGFELPLLVALLIAAEVILTASLTESMGVAFCTTLVYVTVSILIDFLTGPQPPERS